MAKSDLRSGTTWIPRGLSREEAAYYIGVSASKFDHLVADGRMPKPIRVDGRVIWDRIKLDMAFSDLGEVRVNRLDAMLESARSDHGERKAAPPLSIWAKKVMRQFDGTRAGGTVRAQAIFGLGPTTAEELQKRGFIEPRYSEKSPDQIDRWMVTEAGAEAVKRELGHR